MTTFTGTLNIKLIEIRSVESDSNKNLDLFVSVDQHHIYQTTTTNRNSTLNESISSQVEGGKNVRFTLYNDSPKSVDDIVAKCVVAFEDIRKNEKVDDVYDLKINLEPSGQLHFAIELIEKAENAGNENSNHRSAIRKKVHQINGHKFIASLLKQPSYCSHCHEFIYGLGLQGYRCKCCKVVVHKKCHQSVETKCKSTKTAFPDESVKTQSNVDVKHNFESHTYTVTNNL